MAEHNLAEQLRDLERSESVCQKRLRAQIESNEQLQRELSDKDRALRDLRTQAKQVWDEF